MRNLPFALCLAVLPLAGCSNEPKAEAAQPLTEADAKAVVDNFSQAIQSMDVAKIDAMYADNVVGFDPSSPDRVDGKVAMHVMNVQFAAMKMDHVDMSDPKIQIIGPDLFIASGLSRFTSSTGKVKSTQVRYSEVFQKQADDSWKVIHEHLDFPPKA